MLRNDLYVPWFANKGEWGFEIISGNFINTVLQIEHVEFVDEGVQLQYHIIRRPDSLNEGETNNPLFVQTVELIVNDILTEAVRDYEQNRDDNIQESSP